VIRNDIVDGLTGPKMAFILLFSRRASTSSCAPVATKGSYENPFHEA
jgi:hypothetical protein